MGISRGLEGPNSKADFLKNNKKTHTITLESIADYQSEHRSSAGVVDLIVKDKR